MTLPLFDLKIKTLGSKDAVNLQYVYNYCIYSLNRLVYSRNLECRYKPSATVMLICFVAVDNLLLIWTFTLYLYKINNSCSLSKAKSFYEPSDAWSQHLSLFSVVLSGWESLTTSGRDTNPSPVSSQQMLLPWKDGKLSLLRQERLHKCSILGRAGDWTGHLVVRRQRSYQLRQPRPPVACESHAYIQFIS